MAREDLLVSTLVQLADTLVDDFDVAELLTLLTDRCVEVLNVSAAGLMLATPDGVLKVVASSSDAMRVLELFEIQADEGPCPDCFRTGEPALDERLAASGARWPRFAPEALAAGFRSVHALPMHLRSRTIGALNLFRAEEGGLSEADLVAAQAFADVASIAVIQHRASADSQLLNAQLNQALTSRIVIEQAKGMVAERSNVDMETAFARLRDHARSNNRRLADVAREVTDGRLPPDAFDSPRRPPRR